MPPVVCYRWSPWLQWMWPGHDIVFVNFPSPHRIFFYEKIDSLYCWMDLKTQLHCHIEPHIVWYGTVTKLEIKQILFLHWFLPTFIHTPLQHNCISQVGLLVRPQKHFSRNKNGNIVSRTHSALIATCANGLQTSWCESCVKSNKNYMKRITNHKYLIPMITVLLHFPNQWRKKTVISP